MEATVVWAALAGTSSAGAWEAAAAGEDQNAEECWIGDFTAERCCDTPRYGPEGDRNCWSGDFSFANCCGSSKSSSLLAPPGGQDAPEADEAASKGEDGLAVSRSCWRGGYNFYSCCTRARPGGDASCWDGREFTFERCCRPPQGTPAAFPFLDVNCDRQGEQWSRLREELTNLEQAARQGRLHEAVPASQVDLHTWARSLWRRGLALPGVCPLGRVSLAAACLLLCLATPGACGQWWAAAASAMREDSLSITHWASSTWPVLHLFGHIAAVVREADPSCWKRDGDADWPVLHKQALDDSGLSSMEAIYRTTLTNPFQTTCAAGFQWVSTVKMSLCARLEVKCARGPEIILSWRLRDAAASGSRLRGWAALAGDWRLPQHQAVILKSVMRHKYTLGLTPTELGVLGIEPPAEAAFRGCAARPHGGAHDAAASLHPLEPRGPAWNLVYCRAQCGYALDSHREPWELFGLLAEHEVGMLACMCARSSVLRAPGNCSALGQVALHKMPALWSAWAIKGGLDGVRHLAPVLSQASESLQSLSSSFPVFVTMVFGHMAQHLRPFARRVELLGVPNVVVFVLDRNAKEICESVMFNGARRRLVCVQGEGQSSLQKYVVVIAYALFGRDVFWFDFDSVWLKNPVPALRQAEEDWRRGTASAESQPGAHSPMVFTAIDLDSVNCAMNAFFLVKSSSQTFAWLLALLHWVYRRPFVHDQVAFAQLLGIGPLIDDEPLPAPPPWAPLDPNVFANAARFDGLGFSSQVEDLVLFHFFDGWNSNMPGETEQFATSTYRGQNLFEVLYGDEEGARAAIEKSRLPPPVKLRDCTYMSDLGLGVTLQKEVTISVPGR